MSMLNFNVVLAVVAKILQISSGSKISVKFKFLLITEVYSP